MFNVYSLFSVNVFEGKIIVPINIHKKILNIIEEKYEKEGKRDSCVNGFQYHENFDGKKELNEIINKHLLSMHNLKIINGWLNVLENQSYNLPHSHTADDIKMAGVLYLSSQNTNITFTREGEVFEIKPKMFQYLIFPFNLVHYVLPENIMQKRISYAFNLK
jgi:hypothetical protein|tara:strand:+ start:102 stop:587 length:486 start_codon:yes stop_codon:yes gene_type:complete